MDKSKIEWTDATWNPLRGCSRVSEGCRNCYAERVAARFSSGPYIDPSQEADREDIPAQPYHGLAKMTPDGPRWTGDVRLVKYKLSDPRRWKRPRRIFVNSMSDLFHEKVPDAWIDQIFAVMALAPQHTFQVLTKRPERMRQYLGSGSYESHRRVQVWNARLPMCGKPVPPMDWPLKNVWLGVSVENQATADERIPLLIHAPAARRWISYEPALGPVNLNDYLLQQIVGGPHDGKLFYGLNWVVVGGESGPGARPFDVSWAHEIVKSCKAVEVPVFVKQLGACVVTQNANLFDFPMSIQAHEFGEAAASARYMLRDKKGGDMAEWPEELRVREFPQ